MPVQPLIIRPLVTRSVEAGGEELKAPFTVQPASPDGQEQEVPFWMVRGRPQLTSFSDIMASGEYHPYNPLTEDIWRGYVQLGQQVRAFAGAAVRHAVEFPARVKAVDYAAAGRMVLGAFMQRAVIKQESPEERWDRHYSAVLAGLEARASDIDRKLEDVVARMMSPHGSGLDPLRLALQQERDEIDTPEKRHTQASEAARRHAHTYLAGEDEISELTERLSGSKAPLQPQENIPNHI